MLFSFQNSDLNLANMGNTDNRALNTSGFESCCFRESAGRYVASNALPESKPYQNQKVRDSVLQKYLEWRGYVHGRFWFAETESIGRITRTCSYHITLASKYSNATRHAEHNIDISCAKLYHSMIFSLNSFLLRFTQVFS